MKSEGKRTPIHVHRDEAWRTFERDVDGAVASLPRRHRHRGLVGRGPGLRRKQPEGSRRRLLHDHLSFHNALERGEHNVMVLRVGGCGRGCSVEGVEGASPPAGDYGGSAVCLQQVHARVVLLMSDRTQKMVCQFSQLSSADSPACFTPALAWSHSARTIFTADGDAPTST
jgi:hypothetical protein